MKKGALNKLNKLLDRVHLTESRIMVLSGAGISAESNIPTFRGAEGYWTVGSKVYQPHQMATHQMFAANPEAVWQWYLYRLGVCQAAHPNSGHDALIDLEHLIGSRFTLVTQNVDNLHLRAGQDPSRTFQIHGNIFYVRCSADCHQSIYPLPAGVSSKANDETLSSTELDSLHCPRCHGLLRPHVLWFDETYNEHYYYIDSTMAAARASSILIVVGTSGATNLPNQVVAEVVRHNGWLIDINIDINPFGNFAEHYDRGLSIRDTSSSALKAIVSSIDERVS